MARTFVEPDTDLIVAPSEVPQDVNLNDPDDEDLHFYYDNWRDWEDYDRNSEDHYIAAMEEYDEHFFQDSQEIL